ncbi:hypothetical protein [Mesorhizobium sp. YR577]|nr:hypothetical protein [Mesorhizobium sp. YR577]SFU14160.1 hypothetical protein SAMN05518861_11512 [Mesorhizobium sp. YR577]
MAENKTQADHEQHGKHDGLITGRQKQKARLIGEQMARNEQVRRGYQ